MAMIDEPVMVEPRLAKDGRLPAYLFYPSDFERDVAGLSLASQGLWIRMLGWMHQNEAHRGFLELPSGQPMTEKQIALRVGRGLREVRPLIEELKNFGLFSIAPSGAIYSRRMARETHISGVRRMAAKSRADKATRAIDGKFVPAFDGDFVPANTPANGEQNSDLSVSSSFSVSKDNKTSCASSDARTSDSALSISKPPSPATTQTPAKGPDSLTPEQEGWFTSWWDSYWLHKAKKAARRAFGKQVRTEDRFQQVMEATRAQSAEMLSREPHHRPHGASWLNGERWADEAAKPKSDAERDELLRRFSK